MYEGLRLGIVVPAYNEERLIAETLQGMPEYADRIYVVDDGSTDATRQIIEGFNGGRFCVLSNGRNKGVGAGKASSGLHARICVPQRHTGTKCIDTIRSPA